jgi:hypothetical protein
LQGHSLSIFRRAIERGNLTVAEATARELLRISLTDALELTILIARKDPRQQPAGRSPLVAALPRGEPRHDDRRGSVGVFLSRRTGLRSSGRSACASGHGRKSD